MTVGAYWARNLAPGGIRRHDLSQPVTGEFRHHARSEGNSRRYEVAPPAGFEPALTAPEGNSIQVSDEQQTQRSSHPGALWGRGGV
jgi:hypothetical protein